MVLCHPLKFHNQSNYIVSIYNSMFILRSNFNLWWELYITDRFVKQIKATFDPQPNKFIKLIVDRSLEKATLDK